MAVTEIDARTASDAELRRFAELEHACAPELAPGEPLRSVAEIVAFHRFQPETHASFHWLADGGMAMLNVHGPAAAFMQLRVHPDRRRRGIGTALVRAVIERARELEATALHAHHMTPAGSAFLRKLGFVDGQRIVDSVLDLRAADLPEPSLPEGWGLVTWLTRVPDEHLLTFVVARGAMDDAPASEGMDFPTWTAEKIRASEESLVQREREMRVTVAMRDDGVIGAFTELRLSRGSVAGFTDDTGTVAQHRGQGLARAVKVESLRRLRADHPEVEVVTTSNAEENAAMRHINESVGFRPTATVVQSTLVLQVASAK